MEARNLLIYLSIKYKGSFEKMYTAIKNKEEVTDEQINEALKKIDKKKVITILDKEYPVGSDFAESLELKDAIASLKNYSEKTKQDVTIKVYDLTSEISL